MLLAPPPLPIEQDLYKKTPFLWTDRVGINLAWYYLIRESTTLMIHDPKCSGETEPWEWKNTEEHRHYPIMLHPPFRITKKTILEGFEQLSDRYGISQDDASVVSSESELILFRVSKETEQGRRLMNLIDKSRSNCAVADNLCPKLHMRADRHYVGGNTYTMVHRLQTFDRSTPKQFQRFFEHLEIPITFRGISRKKITEHYGSAPHAKDMAKYPHMKFRGSHEAFNALENALREHISARYWVGHQNRQINGLRNAYEKS